MQSMLNLHGSYGLPLCVSGLSHLHTLSREIADHDRRRKELKRQSSRARRRVNQDTGMHENEERLQENNKNGEVDEDLAVYLHDLSKSYFSCSAKAA